MLLPVMTPQRSKAMFLFNRSFLAVLAALVVAAAPLLLAN
jgi:hypothetical protein